MMLEDVNDVEFRKLRSKVSSLSLETKHLSTKNNNQKEQSKLPRQLREGQWTPSSPATLWGQSESPD